MKFGSTLPFGFPKATTSWKLTGFGGVPGESVESYLEGLGRAGGDGEGDQIERMGSGGRAHSWLRGFRRLEPGPRLTPASPEAQSTQPLTPKTGSCRKLWAEVLIKT